MIPSATCDEQWCLELHRHIGMCGKSIPGVARVFNILYSDPRGLVSVILRVGSSDPRGVASVILGVGSSDPRGVASVILGGGKARHFFQLNFASSWCMAYRQ